jgi:large subunit ribosomal protein L21
LALQLVFRLPDRTGSPGAVGGMFAGLLQTPRFSKLRQIGATEADRRFSRPSEDSAMYAVIRTGGKQYVVSPGEQLKLERTAHQNGTIEFSDVLAVSGADGKYEKDLSGAKVTASVVNEGRGEKILVFKLKRKKQYKKMQGHRQNYVQVRINEIFVNGQSYKGE